ncbi:CMGC/CDK/CRK7 protein kinase [Kwoniella heveanensis CBS 569]|nr:CMGC/CDK/CRK7 protein kinase [Kwoniella heveanensis CBS 569]
MFMSGPSNNGPAGRQPWGRRDREREKDDIGSGSSRDRWGRDERDRDGDNQHSRMDVDESPSRRNFNSRPPLPPQDSLLLPYETQNGHPPSFAPAPQQPPLGPRSSMPPFPPNQPPAFAQISKPPPPPSDILPYGSPTQSSSPTLPKPDPITTAIGPASTTSGPVKIAFGSASPTKGRWKSISPNKTVVQRLFDGSTSPSGPSLPTVQEKSTPSALNEGSSHPPNTYLDRIEASERQYSAHLSSIAPYIKAAFNEWFEQGTSPPLPAFLIHYFGREPSDNELAQIERLLDLRNKTSQDQEEWRGLHAKAQARGDSRAYGSSQGQEIGHVGTVGVNAIPLPTSRWTPSAAKAAVAATAANDMPTPTSLPSTQYDTTSPYAQQSRIAHAGRDISSAPAEPTLAAPPANMTHREPSSPAKPRGTYNASGEMYEKLSHVGEGTYGKVYKARSNDDGSMVALKRIRMEGEKDGFPVTAMREIKLLQGLRHGNVVRLLEIMVSKGSVHMVFEYMDHDLTGLLAHPTLTFNPGNIKSLSHQMLAGLSYLHDRSILHRDMKGSNILLNSRGELKLADFGLARWYSKRHRDDYTNRVITLWYRSPELLMGETVYGPEVDMWSAGCIMLEIFTTKPIFQGSDEINQLDVIYGIMGTPDEAAWPGVKDLPWYELVKPKDVIESKFRASFAKWLSPAALDLVEGLLAFDPTKRLSAKEAMATTYFTSEEPPMEVPSQ